MQFRTVNYQPKNILVTGGAGFIGANFIQYILKRDDSINVYNLDLLTYAGSLKNLENLRDKVNYKFIQGDIRDRQLVDSLLSQYKIDTIINFAAESHVDNSILAPEAFIQTNVVGTFTLLEAARNYWLLLQGLDHNACRFHHISTDEVYGTLDENALPFTELTPYSPNSPYSASKAGADHLVLAYFTTYGLPVTITNCSNNYGPYQHREKFIPTIIASCLNWEPIPIYGDGQHIRDWLYVEDHCRAIDLVIKGGGIGQKYNVGGGNELKNIDVVKKVCDIMNEILPQKESYEELISFIADRPGHDRRYGVDFTKISQELGWKPNTDFDSGLRKTIIFRINNK